MVQGTNGPRNECSMERIVLITNVPECTPTRHWYPTRLSGNRASNYLAAHGHWSLLNRFRIRTQGCVQPICILQKWCLTFSDKCQCSERQTMTHIEESCPRTKFVTMIETVYVLLHEADDNAVK